MHKELIWSPLADDDLNNILEYLLSNWASAVAENFIDLIDNNIERVISNPRQFPLVYKTRKYRKCVITKHNTLYYKELDNSIMILRIFDTRQSPRKLKLNL